MFKLEELKHLLESLLFVSDEPLSAKKCAAVLEIEESMAKKVLEILKDDYRQAGRGIQIRKIAGGYRMYTHPANSQYVEKLLLTWDGRRLTQAALETLAIVAYRQPVTKMEVNGVRGVNSEGVISSLADKGLLREVGRENSPGQPILYGTTKIFLERFGLNSIKDLPPLVEFTPDDDTLTTIKTQLYADDKVYIDGE